MILSQSHKFLFVHVPKTAGTALTAALSPFGVTGTRHLWRRLLRRLPVTESPDHAYLRKHETAADIRRKLSPAVFDRYHRFAVVRNPFDHAVSHYEYLKEFRNARIARQMSAMSFTEYLHHRIKGKTLTTRFFVRLPDQAHFIADADGALLVHRIMRFESLQDDFKALVRDLALGDVELKQVNRTKAKSGSKSYKSYYDTESSDLVRQLYARDFRILGYSEEL